MLNVEVLKEIIREEIDNLYLYHGTNKQDALSLIRNGIDPSKLISGYIRGFYTYPSIDYIDRHNDTFDSKYEAAVKLKIKPGTKVIHIDDLEKLKPDNGYGSPIHLKTEKAVAMGYSIVSRGAERIIINFDCVEKIELAQLKPIKYRDRLS